jgi:predicted CXXCH cytochrome family protein
MNKTLTHKTIKKKGGVTMKRTLFIALLTILSIAITYSLADAISGVCSNCHTMHDSQDGSAVATGGPNEQLLLDDCVGCHTGPHVSGGLNAAPINAPVVLDTVAPASTGPGNTNAGGDFYWVNAGSDALGHDVIDLPGIGGADSNIGATPPGFNQATTTGQTFDSKTLEVTNNTGWVAVTSQLTCAGTYGCHGTRDAAGIGGIAGAHHSNPGTNQQVTAPTVVGNSYRFLADIDGLEDVDWQWTATATDHNEYKGENNTADRTANANWGSRDTISYLCANCHGTWHGTIDNAAPIGAPWTRHPTDIVLQASPNETSSYNTSDGTNIGTYNIIVPVARGTINSSSTDQVNENSTAADGGIVMCLSCHRAHGSEYPDLLRWDYSTMIAGGTNSGGCFVCHTAKNAVGTNP